MVLQVDVYGQIQYMRECVSVCCVVCVRVHWIEKHFSNFYLSLVNSIIPYIFIYIDTHVYCCKYQPYYLFTRQRSVSDSQQLNDHNYKFCIRLRHHCSASPSLLRSCYGLVYKLGPQQLTNKILAAACTRRPAGEVNDLMEEGWRIELE